MGKKIYIPGRIQNAAVDEEGNRLPVAGAEDIDAGESKNQQQVNKDVDDTLTLHQQEINALDSQNYVTVTAYSSLPATGAINTIYRVSSYDGTQVDATKYAEYAWNGSTYVLLDIKTQVGEVFDISQYRAVGGTLATFDNLADALDSGNNVPSGLRKGGMSIKFVQSSDNKYVQYRLTSQTFTTDETVWYKEGVTVSQIKETGNPVANALIINGQKYDIQDARTSGIVGISGSVSVTANQNFRFDTIQILEGYSYTLKIKSSAVIDLVAITSDNTGSGIRYFWASLDSQQQTITFVADKSIVLQIWSADTFVPNDATITWEIAFSKVVEDKFEIINKAYQYGYLDANGDFQPNANFISSPFVDISDCAKIKFNIGNTPYNNASFNLIHYYNANKEHLTTDDVHTITTAEVIEVPQGASYIRYFVHTGYGFDLYGNTDRNMSSIIYVGSSPTCDYQNIQDAIDNCNDSEENPIAIILLGGTYAPFTMRLPDQTPETYAAMNRHISIIGIDKNVCKVISTSGEYWKPCAEIGTTGVIANISFIHTAASLVSGGSAYAVHLDWPTNGRKETFKDCYFESNVGPAFGLGLHQDETVEFVNCTFIRTEGYGDDLGALFGHLSSSAATNQNLILKGCTLKNNITTSGSHPAISLSGTGSNGKRLFQNTICKNVDGPSENILGNWDNDEMSFNNIPTNLNA